MTTAGAMSVCLPVWARPKVTSCWQVVKMPLEPGRVFWGGGGEPALKSDPGSKPVCPWAGPPPSLSRDLFLQQTGQGFLGRV